MHFRNTTYLNMISDAFKMVKTAKLVFFMLCFQSIVAVALLVLKTIAPIGISQSKNYRIHRSYITAGETVFREDGQSHSEAYIGEAILKLKTHFDSGGGLLRVGRTGKNPDALLLEDEDYSLGEANLLREFSVSLPINVSKGSNPKVSIPARLLVDGLIDPSDIEKVQVTYSFQFVDYPEPGVQVTEGPLHFMAYRSHFENPLNVRTFKPRREMYSFASCTMERLEVIEDEHKTVNANCRVAILDRDVTLARNWQTVLVLSSPIHEIELLFPYLDISEIGRRWLMMIDTANALSRDSREGAYVAYLPLTQVSKTSVIIMIVLISLALANVVGALFSIMLTRGTLNWNGSYQRVVSLAAYSHSIGPGVISDINMPPRIDLVIESTNDKGGSKNKLHAVSEREELISAQKADLNSISLQIERQEQWRYGV